MTKKAKHYTVSINVVQKFSSTVVVKATSAKQAKQLVEDEFDHGEYLYEKTTECPDVMQVHYSRASRVPEDKTQEALNKYLCSDTCVQE